MTQQENPVQAYVERTIKEINAMHRYGGVTIDRVDYHPHNLPIVSSVYVHFSWPVWERGEPNPDHDEYENALVPAYLPDKSRPPRKIASDSVGALVQGGADNSACPDADCWCKSLYIREVLDENGEFEAGAIAWTREGVAYWDFWSFRKAHRGIKKQWELPALASGYPVADISLSSRVIPGYEVAKSIVDGFYNVLSPSEHCPECDAPLCGACNHCHIFIYGGLQDCSRDGDDFGADCHAVFAQLRAFCLA